MLRPLALFAALLAAAAAPHNVTVTYAPTTGNLSLTFDGSVLVAGARPVINWLGLYNGTEPPNWYEWFHEVNESFAQTSANTYVYGRQYHWGWYNLTHTVSLSAPLPRIDMSLTLVNQLPNTTSETDIAIFGDVFANGLASAWVFPGTPYPRQGLSPCGRSCWDGGCGNAAGCDPLEPLALPMDWGTGAAAYVAYDVVCIPAGGAPYPCSNATFRVMNVNGWHLMATALTMTPGATLNMTLSLRFGDGGGPNNATGPGIALIQDVLDMYAAANPMTTPILPTAPLAAMFGSNCGASCHCATYSPQDCPNPRGWSSEVASNVNVTYPAGVAAFQAGALAWANTSIQLCLHQLGPGPAQCQGVMFWALEGSEYNQDTYVGAPDMVPELAPEMDAIADELLGMINAAGLRVGMTLRPQVLTPNPAWNSSVPPTSVIQKYYQQDLYLPDGSTDVDGYAQNIIRKAKYAIARWNASLFYVDSTVNRNDVLPLSVWLQVTQALPGIVFIPEETYPIYSRVVVPLQDDWGGAPIGVQPAILATYPRAYKYQLMQITPVMNVSLWTPLVHAGHVFRVDGWYTSPTDAFVAQVYAAAYNGTAADAQPR